MSLNVNFAGLQKLFMGAGKATQNRPVTFSGNNVKTGVAATDSYSRQLDKGQEIISSRHETD